MTQGVTKISPVQVVEAWGDPSARVRRTRFSAQQRQQRQQSPLTILRQTTSLNLDEKQLALEQGNTRIEARQRRLELVQVREKITSDPAAMFDQMIEYPGSAAPEAEVYAPAPRSPALASPGSSARNSLKHSAAAYERAQLPPAEPPGAQVNLMA